MSFAFAGKATFDLVNRHSGTVVRLKIWRPSAHYLSGPLVWCITWLDGYDRKFIGRVLSGDPPIYTFDPCPGVTINHVGPKAVFSLMTCLKAGDITKSLAVYPTGKCCKCGRRTGAQAKLYCNKCKSRA